ncbi:histidine kinase [Nostoc linckia z18]|uniref:histidine kinase n=2 Tax=Nostoc linckia TaxID=92942 RepID=A0A9Q5ZFU1_NOSLI|nr:AAA family ATPase [Nostoc linckia]PHK40164.1 histidine kinase [Nostoc linckia z15]PHK47459.1 histidine kinase [Nostoc linckia z16]PHJ68629.1 histidine kinase [Nostoc linckia z1]PHJ70694.1 histidine kinase [Nostoc linckia z3]PHJ76128.1 histidine kinase [Nostoc linckia z2]
MSGKVVETVKIASYEIVEQLYSGSRTKVYRAIRECNCQPVVIKLLKREYPTLGELLQFRNQYAIAKNLDIPGIIKPYSLEAYNNGYALVMEDFGGVSLREFTCAKPLPLEEFLPIALQLLDTLHQLHQQRVIHKDIKPANILIHPDSKQVKLIDFSIASLLPRETQEIQSINGLQGTLAYLSPEQTGRMNRGIDYRSDFYSLGVTFFELLSGQLPFTSDEPMELVYFHIAKQPPSICDLNPKMPLMLGEIVGKLMAKNAEDRYQSTLGLKYDLEKCCREWQATGKHTWFDLAQHDISSRFLIREKLYGREQEVQTLLEAFGRIANGGAELMLVAGFSGIGKTAVVNEVHKPIVRWSGYFIKGKYDQFNRNIPLSAFVRACRDLMTQLLGQSDSQLEQWRTKILSALGESGQVIIEVIPELEQIIGKQPPTPELSGSAAQNRFNLLFVKFIQVFATREHPLVVFLDDLQWADSASLNLLKLLMDETVNGYLFIIGAYRDNEVFAAHPLLLILEDIRKVATVNTLTLMNLSQRDVNYLIADTLSCSTEIALPLAGLVYQKTKGNPFFTTQFLKALHEEGLINFNWDAGFWQCDVAQVRSLALTDDVVEFMAIQLLKLSPKTQEVLQLAACIGNQFDLNTLAIIYQKSQTETAADLWKALQEGFVIPINEVYKFYQDASLPTTHDNGQKTVYKFLHDRIQQAAYSLIPEEQKQATHLQIGQLLLNNTPITELDANLFEIVNQLNIGKSLIIERLPQIEIAALNLQAGKKAKAATAYAAAYQYSTTGLALLNFSPSLDDNCWQTHYDPTLELHELAAETAYLSGDFRQMEQWADVVIQQAKTAVDKMKVYGVKIQASMAQVKKLEAVKIGLEALKLVGVTIPESPQPSDIQQALSQVASNLETKNIEELTNLPLMTDIEHLSAARMLATIGPATYQAAPILFPLVISELVNLSITYGNSPFSSYGYACYGILLNAIFKNIKSAYQIGKLALNLAENFNVPDIKGSTFFVVGVCILHAKVHLKETLPILWDAYQSGLEGGNFVFATHAAIHKYQHTYLMGQELTIVAQEMATMSHVLTRLKQENALNFHQIFQQSVLNLLNISENPCILQGEVYNEEIGLPKLINAHDRTGLHHFYFNKLILYYLFGDYSQAQTNALQAEEYLDGVPGLVVVPVSYFYDSLAHLAIYPSVADSQRENLLNRVRNNQEKMQQWASDAPMNFQHKFDLVAAEQYRILGNKADAIDYYDRAITLAKEHGYIQEQALANELAAKFYLDWGKQRIAQEYITEAYYGYAHWGAKAKVADLEKRYPQLLAPILQQTHSLLSTSETIFNLGTITSTNSASSSSSNVSVALDLAAVLKASQILSGEIELEKLLSTLLDILIENSGAEKCVLLLSHEQQLMVQSVTGSDFCPMLHKPQFLEDSEDVPISLINTVKRTLEPAVIIDARVNRQLTNDPYIQRQQPKSILCSPILHQGQLLGVLYLENNLVTGAFTSDRVKLLNLLCAQAAISLENARLYANSQNYAQQLAQSLAKLQASETRFQNLANNIPGMVYQFRLAADGSNSTPYVSSGCLDLYGLEPESVMAGKHSLYAMHHPEDDTAIAKAMIYSAQTLTPFKQEWRIILPSGSIKWIQSAARPERQADGAIVWDGVVIDISDRKQIEASLAKEREFLNAIIHNITDGIVVCDATGNLTLFNKATCEFHGLPIQSLPPEAWAEHFDLYQPDAKTPLSTTEIPLVRAFQGEIVENLEIVIAPKHGLRRILLSSGQAIFDSQGNKLGAVVVMRDISDRKLTEIALQQKSQDLEQALINLQNAQLQIIQSEKMSALGNLVAGVAHEMNNPLGFIAATLKQAKPTFADFVEHLRLYQESLSHKSEKILDHAQEIDLDYILEDLPKAIDSMTMACERLKNISTSLCTFSRGDRDYKVSFNIHQGIDSTILILKHRLKANEQRPAIEVLTEYGKIPQIECFPGQLNQVFMNILANAIDALEDANNGRSFEEIKLNRNLIKIKTFLENNSVKVIISDNGKGMTEEVKQKIFDNLFTTKGVGKGTGLGLAIARQIILEKHGGSISVNSQLGEGTEFIIQLPCVGNN